MTSRPTHWCPKIVKWRPCWCPKSILWEMISFLLQTLSFVPINLHRFWPREWKRSMVKGRPCWCPKPILWELNSFLMPNFFLVQWISKAAGHVISHASENALYLQEITQHLYFDNFFNYFGGARSKGFATLKNVSKLPFLTDWASKVCRFSVPFGYLTKWEPN